MRRGICTPCIWITQLVPSDISNLKAFFLGNFAQKLPHGLAIAFSLVFFKKLFCEQTVISHASKTVNQTEGIPIIKMFLSKHCADHPNNWDDHPSAVSFAFNITHLKPTKNTPHFQMFHRNPYIPETSDVLREVDSDNTSMFAKVIGAIKEADKIMENKTTTVGKVILFNRKFYNRKCVVYKMIFKNILA